ncbi:MAG: ComF family protein [Candidatus Terrybacteria bacterium]|nr:ComF family protein [Candidatus Terrybacteria bacterium]
MVRAAIDAFKYEGVQSLAGPLAALLKRPLETALHQTRNPLLVPIPMHERRLRSRGFNQAALLARVLGTVLDIPENEQILERSRDTDQQAKLPHAARAENIRGAFTVIAEKKLDASLTIILIDDVVTTGATMKEAAVTLRSAGAREIWGTAVSCG